MERRHEAVAGRITADRDRWLRGQFHVATNELAAWPLMRGSLP